MGSINPFYERPDIVAQLRAMLAKKSPLPQAALQRFLTEPALARARKACANGWTHACLPDQYAYATRKRIPLQDELRAFVTAVAARPLDEGARRFAHRDYTLLHDELEQPAGVVGLLFLETIPEDAGGDVVFTKDGETLGRFVPRENTLLIVRRTRGVRMFVHYLNHRAGKRVVTMLSA